MLLIRPSHLSAAETPTPPDLTPTSTTLDATSAEAFRPGGASPHLASYAAQDNDEVLQAFIPEGILQSWDVGPFADTQQTVRRGDKLLATFSLRCADSMTGQGVAALVFEKASKDHAKSVMTRVSVGARWKEFSVPFVAIADYAPGEAQVGFHMGYMAQTLEVRGLLVRNFGPDVALTDLPRTESSYAGRELDAPWRGEAAQRIEEIRKADIKLRVVDAEGRPVEGASIQLTMTKHAFSFGSAVAVPGLLDPSDAGAKYREITRSWFNEAVFENATKWENHGVATPEQTDTALAWLKENDIKMRGHVLVWPGWDWLPSEAKAVENDPPALRKLVEKRVVSASKRYAGRFYEWDVLNEPFNNHDLMDIFGQDVMVDWFKLARKADPSARLFINDWGILTTGGFDTPHQQHYEDTIAFLLDRDAPLEGIGMQGHFGDAVTPPVELWRTLDRFARFGLPVKITEFDIDSIDRQLQADYTRDFLTAVFAHPSVEGVLVWGFWADRHWKPEAAFFDPEWQIRPHGEAWRELVNRQWWTEVEATTDDHGQVITRGFLGDYDLVVGGPSGSSTEDQKIRFTLSRDGKAVEVMLNE